SCVENGYFAYTIKIASMRKLLWFCPALLMLASCNSSKKRADLIVRNGVIYTVDGRFSVVQAMAIKDGKILATGSNEDINQYASDSVINARGAAIFPGFIDAHSHFHGYAKS